MRNQYEAQEQAFLIGYIKQALPETFPVPFVSVIPRPSMWDPTSDPRNLEGRGVEPNIPRVMICAKDMPVVWIEVISKFSKPSEQQARMHSHLSELGHIVHVVTSAAEAISDLRSMGVLDPIPRLPGVKSVPEQPLDPAPT